MSGDPEFEDFLRRRRPLFPRHEEDLEPSAELDRIVLRQAREAIEVERPLRLFGMPRWAAPVAIAATLVMGLAVVFKTAAPPAQRIPEVTVENMTERVDIQSAVAEVPPAEPASEAATDAIEPDGAVIVTLTPPNAPPVTAGPARDQLAKAAAPAGGASDPGWRRDSKSWQAEIERLRASGDRVRADAEQAEYNRQYRALAVSPDR